MPDDINSNEAAFKLLSGQALSSAEAAELRDELLKTTGPIEIEFGSGKTVTLNDSDGILCNTSIQTTASILAGFFAPRTPGAAGKFTNRYGRGITVDGASSGVGGSIMVDGYVGGQELSADPANPAEGSWVMWQSDGTGSGDDGDIMLKITAGGVTKTTTLVDFSSL